MSKRSNKSHRRQQATMKTVERAGNVYRQKQLKERGMFRSMIYKGKKAVERSRESDE